jgi:hypothetical protein
VGKTIGTRGKTVENGGDDEEGYTENDWIGLKLGEVDHAGGRRKVGYSCDDLEEVGGGWDAN